MEIREYAVEIEKKLKEEFFLKGLPGFQVSLYGADSMVQIELPEEFNQVIMRCDLKKHLSAGKTVEEACQDITETVKAYIKEICPGLKGKQPDYKAVKPNLIMELKSLTVDSESFLHCPCKRVSGTDLYFRPGIGTLKEDGMIGVMPIRIALLSRWGVNAQQLFDDAMRQMEEKYPASFLPLWNVLKEMGDDLEEIKEGMQPVSLFLLTNEARCLGASAAFYPGVQEQIGEKMGNYFLLPSSRHEVLILPEVRGEWTASELRKLVREVNKTVLEPEDILSGEAYHYDTEVRKFEMAEDYEMRTAKQIDERVKARGPVL